MKDEATVAGFADDYAFVIQGLLDLYEADFDIGWLQFALELQETQDTLFFDEKNGRLFQHQRRRQEHAAADEGR